MATYRIELRGVVRAESPDDATRNLKDNWYVYDRQGNCVSAKSTTPGIASHPIIGAMDDYFKIMHIEELPEYEDETMIVPCRTCGASIGRYCRSMMTDKRMDVFHKSRQQDYNRIIFDFEKYASIEGSHI